MKTMIRKSFYKGILLGGIILFTHVLVAKDITFSKKYEWNYEVDKNVNVELRNYDCNVVIESSSVNKVKFEIQIDVEAREQADIDVLKSHLENLGFFVDVLPMWNRTPFADTLLVCTKTDN